ncbi:MAG: spore protease YyaC [Christensenellaceae bacterium]|jgi:putative sporulation protein YyaC|nr:spore protease YyaC [Christensenellaceae bacterium]
MSSQIPVIMCIGSTSIIGDSLGPLVGDILRYKHHAKAYIYGSLKRPINGINYREYLEYINFMHSNPFIIAIDACVGSEIDIGQVKISKSGIRAGAALKKPFSRIGDIGIVGVVALKAEDNLKTLSAVNMENLIDISLAVATRVIKLLDAWFKLQK